MTRLPGVKTTRALSVVGTGQTVKRPWYPVTAKEMISCGGKKRSRFAPNMMVNEPGNGMAMMMMVDNIGGMKASRVKITGAG